MLRRASRIGPARSSRVFGQHVTMTTYLCEETNRQEVANDDVIYQVMYARRCC